VRRVSLEGGVSHKGTGKTEADGEAKHAGKGISLICEHGAILTVELPISRSEDVGNFHVDRR